MSIMALSEQEQMTWMDEGSWMKDHMHEGSHA